MIALLVVTALLLSIFYLASTWKFNYWKDKNVPYLKPLPLLGNYGKYILQQEYPGHLVQKLCLQFPDQPYFGAFYGTEPVLVVQSPDIIKNILTKDFYYCNGREVTKHTVKEVVTQNLFFSGGDTWKLVRQNLTPLFSIAKIKAMFPLIEKCAHKLENMLDRETNISNIIEARDVSARYTMECICSASFGVEGNVMGQEDNNPFKIMANKIFETSFYRGCKIVCRSIWPAIFYGLRLQIFPTEIANFFSQLLKGVFESRGYKPSLKHDFVDLILTLKEKDFLIGDSISNAKTGDDKKTYVKVDDDFLVSQCILFFGAGFETSATTISFTLYEFAKNQEVQRRAAKEIDEYLRRHGNKVNYECVNELPFLEACVYETLRKFPVIGNLTREVMDDYNFPTGLSLDKGVRIHIPVFHLHHNPEYFPEPEKFKPERFLPENKNSVIPYTFFPFGEGSRICIGKRFAIMQVLLGLITFLKKYRLEVAEDMPETIILDARSFLTQPRDQGLKLKFFKRDGWEERTYVRTET